jgi:hypothetical protein
LRPSHAAANDEDAEERQSPPRKGEMLKIDHEYIAPLHIGKCTGIHAAAKTLPGRTLRPPRITPQRIWFFRS